MSPPTPPGPAFAEMALLIRSFQLSRMIQVAVTLDLDAQRETRRRFPALSHRVLTRARR